MKKLVLILFLLTILITSKTSGQETNQDLKNHWSASLSYSPISTFYYYGGSSQKSHDYYTKGIREVIYPIGINLRLARNFNEQLSLTSGLNIKARMTDNFIDMISEFSGAYHEESTDNRYIVELPIGLLYNIKSDPKLFDPYVRTGIRNSYFKRSYVGDYKSWSYMPITGMTEGKIDNHDGCLIIFYDLGVGTFIKASKSLLFMVESNLTYTISGFGYIELLTGLTYSFK
jgi:hypothetical protein